MAHGGHEFDGRTLSRLDDDPHDVGFQFGDAEEHARDDHHRHPEDEHALRAVERYLGRPAKATMSGEVGGLNARVPLYAAARLRLPTVDCDGTGRAFPEVHMSTYTLHGISATPFAMADERSNTVLLETVDNRSTETFARLLTVAMGAVAMIAAYPSTVAQLKEAAVPGAITQAQRIGEAIRTARFRETDPVETVREAAGGFLVFEGKVAGVERRTEGGFRTGHAFIQGIDHFGGHELQLRFQNEFLAARIDGAFAVTVPDMITVLDLDSGQPITAEGLRYGYRVAVIGIPCTPKWRTPAGLGQSSLPFLRLVASVSHFACLALHSGYVPRTACVRVPYTSCFSNTHSTLPGHP